MKLLNKKIIYRIILAVFVLAAGMIVASGDAGAAYSTAGWYQEAGLSDTGYSGGADTWRAQLNFYDTDGAPLTIDSAMVVATWYFDTDGDDDWDEPDESIVLGSFDLQSLSSWTSDPIPIRPNGEPFGEVELRVTISNDGYFQLKSNQHIRQSQAIEGNYWNRNFYLAPLDSEINIGNVSPMNDLDDYSLRFANSGFEGLTSTVKARPGSSIKKIKLYALNYDTGDEYFFEDEYSGLGGSIPETISFKPEPSDFQLTDGAYSWGIVYMEDAEAGYFYNTTDFENFVYDNVPPPSTYYDFFATEMPPPIGWMRVNSYAIEEDSGVTVSGVRYIAIFIDDMGAPKKYCPLGAPVDGWEGGSLNQRYCQYFFQDTGEFPVEHDYKTVFEDWAGNQRVLTGKFTNNGTKPLASMQVFIRYIDGYGAFGEEVSCVSDIFQASAGGDAPGEVTDADPPNPNWPVDPIPADWGGTGVNWYHSGTDVSPLNVWLRAPLTTKCGDLTNPDFPFAFTAGCNAGSSDEYCNAVANLGGRDDVYFYYNGGEVGVERHQRYHQMSWSFYTKQLRESPMLFEGYDNPDGTGTVDDDYTFNFSAGSDSREIWKFYDQGFSDKTVIAPYESNVLRFNKWSSGCENNPIEGETKCVFSSDFNSRILKAEYGFIRKISVKSYVKKIESPDLTITSLPSLSPSPNPTPINFESMENPSALEFTLTAPASFNNENFSLWVGCDKIDPNDAKICKIEDWYNLLEKDIRVYYGGVPDPTGDPTQEGQVKVRSSAGNWVLPYFSVDDSNLTNNKMRIMTSEGIKALDLINPSDQNASNVKIFDGTNIWAVRGSLE